MRLFFALWPPRETADALHAWAVQLQRECGGRVTSAGKIHVTLQFLGDVPETDIERLKPPPFKRREVRLAVARYWRHNQIVWAGEGEADGIHVTLVRKASRPQAFPPLPALSWPVTEILLVKSQLGPKGSRYEVLRRYPPPATGTAA